ncbi:hypothetical protein F5X68DRAFT_36370 [Plectosphaerella plurivora]|uniref:Oxidoreductase-like protein n=1 Tax=Plectosphaerella plurivora TaxID=936078 RepID=A0A9P8V5U0_9PEZI|nr:hypothetical protein F5X68DRAFT_36370 [Plectosphaerella plurivora]
MASVIEARSLASINALAANPPQYPVNPAEEKQDPLTLYISRVPGTRDVILSTSKPQLKNVTAHDVANSLYYIHLELPGEKQASSPVSHGLESPRSSFESGRSENRIKRKPLPATSRLQSSTSPTRPPPPPPAAAATQPLTPPPAYDDLPAPRPQSQSHPLPQVPQQLPPPPPPHDPQTVPARPSPDPKRWTGDGGRTWYSVEDGPDMTRSSQLSRSPQDQRRPVPDSQRFSTPTSPSRDGPLPPLPTRPSEREPPAPQLPPRPSYSNNSPPRQTRAERPTQAQSRPRSRSPSPIKYHNTTAVPYVLHIIRRDANTGHQWNVGSISSSQLEHALDEDYAYTSFDPAGLANSDARRKTTSPQPEINVMLETSGYAKFRGMPSRRSVDDATRRALGNGPGATSQTSLGDAASVRHGEAGFSRRVVMTYTKSFTSNLREKFAATTLKPEEIRPGPPSSHRHSRQLSNVSANSADSAASHSDDAARPIVTSPGHGLRPKGYMFLSPWDGACHFRTGNGGRSLKMRHTLPSPGPGHPAPSAVASELRFNLPGHELFHKGKDEAMARKAELSGHIGKLIRGDDWADDSQLGKEKAGGGNRGKRAKLGKLIIYPEGMKMLDLCVAANLGVWWGTYEKTF